MSIIRVRKDARYFTASNEPFVDKRLSWETRGLIGYLLTKPDHWEVRVEDLEKQGPAKLHKIRRMLAEARLYGYMNRIRFVTDAGTFDWITEVFESPLQNPTPSKGFIKSSVRLSTSGSSTSGSSTTGKPADIVSTDLISTELNVNERTAILKKLYENNIAMCIPIMWEKLKLAAAEFTDSTWYEPAFAVAVDRNAMNWGFVYAVLSNWKTKGRDWKPGQEKSAKKTNGSKTQQQPVQEYNYDALRAQMLEYEKENK